MKGVVHFNYPDASSGAWLCDCDISRDHDQSGKPVVDGRSRPTPRKENGVDYHTFIRTTEDGKLRELQVPEVSGIVSMSPEALASLILLAKIDGVDHKEGNLVLRHKFDFVKYALEHLGYGEV